MIVKNLGNVERVLRIVTGIGLILVLLGQSEVSTVDWLLGIAGILLILNGIFSRCYVWFLFDLNTHKSKDASCRYS